MNPTAEQTWTTEAKGYPPKGGLKPGFLGARKVYLPGLSRRGRFFLFQSRVLQPLLDGLVVVSWLGLALCPWDKWYGGKVRLSEALQGISAAHPLGTDSMGRDMLVRLSGAIHHGVLPLWLSVAIGVLCGGIVALICLTCGRRSRLWLSVKLVDIVAVTLATIPAGVMAFAWGAVRERVNLLGVMWTLGVLFAVRMYLLVRDLERRDQKLGFWTAHEALGGATLSRIWNYGFRGAWSAELLESLSLNLRVAVAIEAAVSYLGFGVAEPAASFGNMLATHFDYYLKGRVEVVMPIILGLGLTAMFPVALVRTYRRLTGQLP